MAAPHLDFLRLAEKRAEHAFHVACAKRLEAEIAEDSATAGDVGTFDPAWKAGVHLSAQGKLAIINAYRRGMRPADVARLFRITDKAAFDWQERTRTMLASGQAIDAQRAARPVETIIVD